MVPVPVDSQILNRPGRPGGRTLDITTYGQGSEGLAAICQDRSGGHIPSIDQCGNVKQNTRLSTTDVYRSFQRLAEISGIADITITGHSCRVGMAQDLTANGAELGAIMQAGRWKSPQMPARYGERLAAGRGAVAQLYGKKDVGFRMLEKQSGTEHEDGRLKCNHVMESVNHHIGKCGIQIRPISRRLDGIHCLLV
ncbi:MAG: tyrosine-type recombinase/integrase [Magnetococcales bacterium]|nr:tyrosine-type recombinase/integrase [Magnetococcales bacterium]